MQLRHLLLLPIALLPVSCEDGSAVIILTDDEPAQEWDATLAGWALDQADHPVSWVDEPMFLELDFLGTYFGEDEYEVDLEGLLDIPLFDPWSNALIGALLLDLDHFDHEVGFYDPGSPAGPFGGLDFDESCVFWDDALGWIKVEFDFCLAPLDDFLQWADQGDLVWNVRVSVQDFWGVYLPYGDVAGVSSIAWRID